MKDYHLIRPTDGYPGVLLKDALNATPLVNASFDCWGAGCAEDGGGRPDWDSAVVESAVKTLLSDMALRFKIPELEDIGGLYMFRGRDPLGFGAALRDMAAVLVQAGYAVRLGRDGFDVYEMKDVPADVEASMRRLMTGYELDIEPAAEPVAYTHFDCWGDESDDESFSPDSIRAAEVAFDVIEYWSQSLSLPNIYPCNMYASKEAFIAAYMKDSGNEIFESVKELLIRAGLSVYMSDTRIEIYHTIDLDLDELPKDDNGDDAVAIDGNPDAACRGSCGA